jgi:hypothetical protein
MRRSAPLRHPSDIDSPVNALCRVLYAGSMTFATQPITPLPSRVVPARNRRSRRRDRPIARGDNPLAGPAPRVPQAPVVPADLGEAIGAWPPLGSPRIPGAWSVLRVGRCRPGDRQPDAVRDGGGEDRGSSVRIGRCRACLVDPWPPRLVRANGRRGHSAPLADRREPWAASPAAHRPGWV